jgi:hypothetical protein
MKRVLLTALAAGLMASGAAQAVSYGGTYAITNPNGLSVFNVTGVSFTYLNASLIVNDALGTALLTGTGKGSNNVNYNINVAFTGAYAAGSEQRWANYTGAITNGLNIQGIFDGMVGVDSMDARLGINAAPYNANTTQLEFGFWSYDKAAGVAGRVHNFDMNNVVSCTKNAAGVAVSATATGACGTPSNVPVPGTIALLGAAALGLGLRGKKRA